MKKLWLAFLALLVLALVLPARADRFVATGGNWKPTGTWTRVGPTTGGRAAPGTALPRQDQARIPAGVTVLSQGRVQLDSLTVNGSLGGMNSRTSIEVQANGDITVGPNGKVGGDPGGHNGVNLTSTNGVVNVQGSVESHDQPLVIAGKTGVSVSGNVRANGSNANVSSSDGSVNITATGRVTASKQVDINSGPGKNTQIDGFVQSDKGDVVINGGAKPQPKQPKPPGNVHVGPNAMVLAPNGEVIIHADTLVVEGIIKGNTVQKHCNKVIIKGGGRIEGKGSEIDYEKEKKSEEHPPDQPAEKAGAHFTIGPEMARFELSAGAIQADASVMVAGGPGSVIDLTGNLPGFLAIDCPGPIALNADLVMLPPGVPIETICGPGPVILGPGGPVLKVATHPIWADEAYAGLPLEVHFGVLNLGNVPDQIEITVTDSLGWVALPPIGPILLDPLDYDTTIGIPFPVPPWAIPDVDTNRLRLHVRSLLDPTIEYSEDVLLPVRDQRELMDATVAPFQVVAPHAGEPAGITWWLENTGALPLALELLITDELGWGFGPPLLALPLAPGEEALLPTTAVIPPGEPDGTVNHVYARLQEPSGELVAADTVEVVVGSLTGVEAGELPAAWTPRHGCRPNPFNPAVEIWFEMPVGGEARVAVHDLRGRLVRTVFAGAVAAGRHASVWDGRAADGSACGSGVYVYRVTAAGRSATGKLVLAR